MQKSTTKSAIQTQKLGEKLAKEILQQKLGKAALVLGLQGDLGAGKTTFLQGFAKGLGIKEKITSPTFIIMKKFKVPTQPMTKTTLERSFGHRLFYHLDCYRLNEPEEILSLGFEEIVSNPENIVAIEWPEKISKVLPKKIILIKFTHNSKNQRTLTIY